jgi:hypothetical protein
MGKVDIAVIVEQMHFTVATAAYIAKKRLLLDDNFRRQWQQSKVQAVL